MMRRAQVLGFTLIEILVAVGVLAIMSSLIFAIMSSIFTVSRDMDDLVEVNHMARVSMDRMTKDISQSFLSLNQGIEETTQTVFKGERDRILFCYVGNVPVKAGELQTDQGVVEYRLGDTSEDRDGRDLVRRFKPYVDDSPDSGGDEFVMARGVQSLRFEYWNRQDEDWNDSWVADDPLANTEPGYILPSRVKITLEMVDERGEEYVFETQTSVYMQRPLLFGQAVSAKAKQHEAKEALKDLGNKGKAAQGVGKAIQGMTGR